MRFNRYNDSTYSSSYSNNYSNNIHYNKPNYYYNNNSNNNNYYNNNYSQIQPKRHQRYSSVDQNNDLKNIVKILGNAMSYAENYAIMNGYQKPKREFTYYDYYNASQKTKKDLYFKKFNASIQNVDNVFEYYEKRYNQMPLPASLSKSSIIERLNDYKKNVNQRDRAAYDNFINVFG